LLLSFSPVLSQHYKLDKNPNYKPTLTFNVWDYDKSSKDDPMGRLVVDLSEFLAVVAGADVHAHISKTFEAVPVTSMKKETVSGTLTFTVQFRPYDM
jgi:Ca2+-dependent lipid-binding protein